MKRLYIVTGANGHLGRHIVSMLLNAEYEVRAFILNGESMPRFRNDYLLQVFNGDICDKSTLEPLFKDIADREVVVIHTAAVIDIRGKVSPLSYRVNVGGTKNIIEMSLKNKVYRYIHISSVHAIPEPKENRVITETKIFDPNTVRGGYAKTKSEASHLVIDAAKNNGLPAIILHPSGIIGPENTGTNNIVEAIKRFVQGKLHVCPEGGYNFVDVRDVAKACLRAVEYGRVGETYILSGRYYQMKEIFKMANSITECKRAFINLPLWFLRIWAPLMERWADYKHKAPLITPYSLFALSNRANFSHEKASRELGFWPRDLYDTLTDTIAEFSWKRKRDYNWRRRVSFDC